MEKNSDGSRGQKRDLRKTKKGGTQGGGEPSRAERSRKGKLLLRKGGLEIRDMKKNSWGKERSHKRKKGKL